MSFFSIGKNEIKEMEKREKLLSDKMRSAKTHFSGQNVCSFNEIVLRNQKKKLDDKLSLLKYLNPESTNEDDSA